MSRTYEALNKAEKEQRGASPRATVTASVNGRHAPNIRWDFDGHARLEYERIGVWMKTPTGGKLLRTIAIVGCRAGSGATTTAALMGATLASSKRSRVLLVDANLSTPSLDLVFGVRNTTGLSDVLYDDKAPEACIQATDRDNVFVLTAGGIPRYPASIFDRAAIERLIEQVTAKFDFVIFDAAPVLQFPATCTLAPCVDGVFLVLKADGTSVGDARRARSDLERADARIVGAILNRHEDHTPGFLRRFRPGA